METKKYVLLLTSIECLLSTTESNNDDVYLKVYCDGVYVGTYFDTNPLKMNEKDDGNIKRYLDIEVEVSATSQVSVNLYDKDDGGNNDDQLGGITIVRDDPLEGNKVAYQTTGDKQSQYRISWRILSKPIPTLRIHGIYCQQSSAGANMAVVDAVLSAASLAAEAASDAIGMVKTPKAKAISKGFDAAATVIDGIALFAEWIANAAEGDDDVYLQHIDRNNPETSKGAFCPPSDSGLKNMKMNDEQEVSFFERFGEYFRFPLDRGPVTIQIMDGDRSSGDDCLGSLTVGDAEYNAYINAGAQVAVAAEYLSGSGQGAVYHICYSVSLDDWALPAIPPEEYVETWSTFSPMGGASMASGPGLIAKDTGKLDCFTISAARNVSLRSLVNGTWSAETDIGSAFGNQRPAATYDRATQRTDVIAYKDDGFAWHCTRTAEGPWSDWQRIENWPITAGCTMTSWRNGRLDAFSRGPNGELTYAKYLDGVWQFANNLGGGIKGAPAAAAWAHGRIDIVARGGNNSLFHRAWDGSRWTPWVDLCGEAMSSAPTLTACGEGTLECVARAAAGDNMVRTFEGGAWGPWRHPRVGGNPQSEPAIVYSGGGRLDMVVRGIDNLLWHSRTV